jgi:hypothetical protein
LKSFEIILTKKIHAVPKIGFNPIFHLMEKLNRQKVCFIDTKLDQERRQPETTLTYSLELPPPLPPRPGRGNIVYPNKPLVRPSVKMKALDWNRIILKRSSESFDIFCDSCFDITILLSY